MRSFARSVAEAVLVSSGCDRLARWSLRGRTLILAYHNVVPDRWARRGDGSLHVAASRFERHVREVARRFTVVGLEDVLSDSGSEAGEGGGRISAAPRVVVTFDDAYRGALTLGIEIMAKRGLPATIFAAPALLGGGPAWWDVLAEAGDGIMDGNLREALMRSGRRGDDLEGPAFRRDRGSLEVPPEFLFGTAGELRAAGRVPGVTVGSHTWSHPSLPALDAASLETELTRSREWLRKRLGEAYVDALSYPYGNAGRREHDAARRAGYRAGFALRRGWFPPREGHVGLGRFDLPRVNVPAGLSWRGLTLRASRP